MNKRGADKIISVYWFAILFIVAAAIVYMAAIFYGEPYDSRELEANALTNHIADCLSEAGYLKENILGNEAFRNNFLETCNLNFNVEAVHGWNNDQFYIEVRALDFNNRERNVFEINEGNLNLKEFCEIEDKNFPFCLERKFYVIDKENNQYVINILSVVRKTEKNVQ